MYSVAVVGLGNVSSVHIDAINSSNNCNLAHVCDIDILKARQIGELYNVDYSSDFNMIISDKAIDSVHILTPHDLHCSMAVEALESGKSVVLEKPAFINADEYYRLIAASEQFRSNIIICFQNRFNTTSKHMKSIIDSGHYGKIVSAKAIVSWCRDYDYYQSSPWKGKILREGGGALISQAIHTLDLLIWLIGSVERFDGMISNLSHNYIECEDTALVNLLHKNGVLSHLYTTISYGRDAPVSIEIVMQDAVLNLENNILTVRKPSGQVYTVVDLPLEGAKSYWGVAHKDMILNFYENYKDSVSHKDFFLSSMETNKLVTDFYNYARG